MTNTFHEWIQSEVRDPPASALPMLKCQFLPQGDWMSHSSIFKVEVVDKSKYDNHWRIKKPFEGRTCATVAPVVNMSLAVLIILYCKKRALTTGFYNWMYLCFTAAALQSFLNEIVHVESRKVPPMDVSWLITLYIFGSHVTVSECCFDLTC